MLLSTWYTKWKKNRIQEADAQARKEGYADGYADGKAENPNRKETIRQLEALREKVRSRPIKITRATVLAQMGHHRTSMDDIIDGLGIKPPNSRLRRFRMLYAFRLMKLGWILIWLLCTGVIGSDDNSGEYWINF